MTARLSWTFERSLTRFLDLPQSTSDGRRRGVARLRSSGSQGRAGCPACDGCTSRRDEALRVRLVAPILPVEARTRAVRPRLRRRRILPYVWQRVPGLLSATA